MEKDSGIEWQEYKIGELFEVTTSKKKFNAVDVIFGGAYRYVARGESNNGIRGYITEDEKYLNESNTISFGQDTATMFYQSAPYFTGDKIKVFRPKKHIKLNRNIAQIFIASMKKAFANFSWGSSSYNVSVLNSTKIQLPTIKKNNASQIAFDFIENFIATLQAQRLATLQAYLVATGLSDYKLTSEEETVLDQYENIEWGKFRLGVLFEKVNTSKLPFKADELPKEMIGNYTLPCLTSSFKNQGLNYFVPKEGATILKNVISIPSNSDVYRAYFQSNEFTILSDAYAIRWNFSDVSLSPKQYLFAVQCINKVTNLSIYSYKNKLGGWNVVKNKYIQLPVKDNKPNYTVMETLISAMQKVAIKNLVEYLDVRIANTSETIQ